MPTIHHAVVKKAAASGVILSHYPDADVVEALRPEPNRRVQLDASGCEDGPSLTDKARDAWNALDEILAFEAEHPGVRIEQEDEDYVAYDVRTAKNPLDEIARDPDFLDLFQSVQEHLDAPDDAEGEEDDEPEGAHSVVPDKYKKLYSERGDPSHCGDWLALTLASLCRITDGKKEVTDLDRLEAIANANDVHPSRYGKLGLASNGWQGRFRMTIRNLLTPKVAAKGFLFVPEGCGVPADTEMAAPEQWAREKAPKPKEDKPKRTRAAKPADAPHSDTGDLGLATAHQALLDAANRKA